MLILTRRLFESVIVGEGTATITVLNIKGDQVRLGIAAAKDIPINREEIYIQKMNNASNGVTRPPRKSV